MAIARYMRIENNSGGYDFAPVVLCEQLPSYESYDAYTYYMKDNAESKGLDPSLFDNIKNLRLVASTCCQHYVQSKLSNDEITYYSGYDYLNRFWQGRIGYKGYSTVIDSQGNTNTTLTNRIDDTIYLSSLYRTTKLLNTWTSNSSQTDAWRVGSLYSSFVGNGFIAWPPNFTWGTSANPIFTEEFGVDYWDYHALYMSEGGVCLTGSALVCFFVEPTAFDIDTGHFNGVTNVRAAFMVGPRYGTSWPDGTVCLAFVTRNLSAEQVTNFNNVVQSLELEVDPLSEGGYSGSNQPGVPFPETGVNPGGDGTFSLQDDDIPESPLPPSTSSIVGSGSGLIYSDTGTNVRSLMRYMWTHADDIVTNMKKIIANPIDSILGLHIMPLVPTVGTATEVFLGNVGTGVSMTPVTNPYIRYRLGTVTINKYWGSALDYSPFTQLNIYLPYIGFRQLNVDDVMDSTCELYYDVDFASGACVAHLKVSRTDPITGRVQVADAYSWPGNMAMQIPVTSTNYQSLYGTIASAIAGISFAVAGQFAGAAAGGAMPDLYSATMSIGQSVSTAANSMYNGGSKIRVDKSGTISGAHGYLSSQYAFIERITPRQSLAATYRNVKGYPSNTSLVLGNCSGFTQVEDINLENFSCTADEKDELERALKGGVIF